MTFSQDHSDRGIHAVSDTGTLASVRSMFPILQRKVRNDRPLVYLDNAATTLKPDSVLDVEFNHYRFGASNIHRGVHFLSEEVTREYEEVRAKVARFIKASSADQIVFTTGTTGSINLVAHSFGPLVCGAGDEVVLTTMEHHANIVPWQMLRERTGCTLKVVPVSDSGALDLDTFEKLLGPRTKIAAFTHISNAIGTINPIAPMIERCRAQGVTTVVDAAQSVAHMPLDVERLGCDFLAFSGHKIYGTPGVGVLYGRKELLEKMPPMNGGGDMVRTVTFEKTTYAAPPARFEAGTPAIGPALALGAAIDFVSRLGFELIQRQEQDLLLYASAKLGDVPGVRIIGTAPDKAAIISFVVEGIHPHDVGSLLDAEGVAIRAGHHCAQPLMKRYGVPATNRASFSFYNTRADADALVAAVINAKRIFA